MRTYLKVDKVAKELKLKPELLLLMMEQYKDRDHLQKEKEYIVSGGETFLTLAGLLWVVSRCDVDFRLAVPLAEKLSTDEEGKRVMEAHKALLKKLPEIKEALLLAQETVDQALNTTLPETEEDSKDSRRQWYKTNSKNLPNLTTEEKEWSSRMNALLGVKSKEYQKMGVHIQKRIYGLMTSRYGIVWDQVKKDTKKRFSLEPEEAITTFRCVVYDPKLRSIYEGLLTDYNGK